MSFLCVCCASTFIFSNLLFLGLSYHPLCSSQPLFLLLYIFVGRGGAVCLCGGKERRRRRGKEEKKERGRMCLREREVQRRGEWSVCPLCFQSTEQHNERKIDATFSFLLCALCARSHFLSWLLFRFRFLSVFFVSGVSAALACLSEMKSHIGFHGGRGIQQFVCDADREGERKKGRKEGGIGEVCAGKKREYVSNGL